MYNLIIIGDKFARITAENYVVKANFTDLKKNKWRETMLFRGTRMYNDNLTSIPRIFAIGKEYQVALTSFNYLLK